MDNYNDNYDGYERDYNRQNYRPDNYPQTTNQYQQTAASQQPEDPRLRDYSGNYAGRYTGQLTGQIPRLEPQDFADQDYNPLDYYKGEGPAVDPRQQRSAQRGPGRPQHAGPRRQPQAGNPRRRPAGRPQHANRAGHFAAPRRGGGDFALVFGKMMSEFAEVFKGLFSLRPENAFRSQLSLPTCLLLITLNVILSALYNLANWHSVFAGAKSVLDAIGGSAVSDALAVSAGAWKVFGVGVLVHALNMILVFALVYAFMQLLQTEYKPPQVSLNTLAVATVPYSLVLIVLSLLGLVIKPLHFYLPGLALIFFYLNLYLGFNEVNEDRRKTAYWLFLLLMVFSLLLVNYLPTVFKI
ncbi:MAG: hypothetical protein Q4P08_00710 [Eubacteriales bacterium]|nr:hypothetical protein [Eubacteriales bacterium]